MLKKWIIGLLLVTVTVVAPVAAQDGPQVVFTGWLAGDYDIFLMDATTGTLRNLTNNDFAQDRSAVWSPDGSQILFISDRETDDDVTYLRYSIYTMSATGENVTQLYNGVNFDSRPVWSPDGTRIAFKTDVADGRNAQCVLLTMDSAGGNIQEHMRIPYCVDFDVAWSPDGESLLFVMKDIGTADRDVAVLNLADNTVTNLTQEVDTVSYDDTSPVWSADGSEIAFVSTRLGGFSVLVMDADGGNVRRLSTTQGDNIGPHWLPDDLLLFGISQDDVYQLTSINADGSNGILLTTSNDYKYSWSVAGDGSQVAYVADDDIYTGGERLIIMGIDGSNVQQYAAPRDSQGVSQLMWRP
jgi:TolB protein